MDETTKDQQGTTSAGDEGSTSKETPTLTEDQAKAREAKARSDALAEVGRLKKAAEDANKLAQGAIKRLQDREEADLAREEEEVKDDPTKLSALKLKRDALKIRKEAEDIKAEAEKTQAETQTQRQELRQHRADRLSEKYSVSSETLLKYGGDSSEGMEELAKSYGEKEGESQKRMTKSPDSGKTKGGTGSQTLDELMAKDVRKMTHLEKLDHKKALEEATKAARSAT